MRRPWARAAPVVLLGFCLLAIAPAGASAHATVQRTSPQRGAIVRSEPKQVVFVFDETVEGNFGAVRVYDTRGERVDEGDAFHPGRAGAQLGVHLKAGLPRGTYTATYRVVSADSHIVSGGFSFSVGAASAAGQTVEDLLGKTKTGVATQAALTAARAVQYAAIAVGGGVFAFLLLVWLGALRAAAGAGEQWRSASEAFLARTRAVLLGAGIAGTSSALACVVLQAAEAAGVSGWTALQPSILEQVMGTRFGMIWTIAAGAWLAFGSLVAVVLAASRWRAPVLKTASVGATGLALPQPARARVGLLALPLGYVMLVPALSGHGSTQGPTGVLFPANVAHVVAMSLWLGGLVALLFVLPAATRVLSPTERSGLLSATLDRFSALALTAVVALTVTGTVQAYVEIRHLDLVFSTAFGRAVFVKVVLLLALVALGAVNRRHNLPRLRAAVRERRSPGTVGVLLRRTLRAEVAVIAMVLFVTGALAGYAPATTVRSGPYATTTRVGPQQLQLTLDPARVGANDLHIYLTDPRSGAQLDRAKEVSVAAALPAKQIRTAPERGRKAGPGHYVFPSLVLGVTGEWDLTLTVRVSEFDEYTKTLKVAVR